jgi:hypothetical protein
VCPAPRDASGRAGHRLLTIGKLMFFIAVVGLLLGFWVLTGDFWMALYSLSREPF